MAGSIGATLPSLWFEHPAAMQILESLKTSSLLFIAYVKSNDDREADDSTRCSCRVSQNQKQEGNVNLKFEISGPNHPQENV